MYSKNNTLTIIREFEDKKFVTLEEIKNATQTKNPSILSYRLRNKDLIRPILRGVYYIPSVHEKYTEASPYFFASFIKNDVTISHGSALTYYDYSEQIYTGNIVTITKRVAKNIIKSGGYNFHMVLNPAGNDFGYEVVSIENVNIRITDKERTILDCFSRPDLCQGIKEIAKAYYAIYDEDDIDFKKLNKYLEKYPNKSKLAKMIGYFSDIYKIDIPENIRSYWEKLMMKNYIHLDINTVGLKGLEYNKKWKLIINPNENYTSLIKY